MSGNICRCAAYPSGRHQTSCGDADMKAFTYQRANTTAHAAAATVIPGAKIIAGGTNLLDLMKLQVETPSQLIDINHLPLDKLRKHPKEACALVRWFATAISRPIPACGSVTAS
jgi:CO/xanthine dehydrogenase FAD-binding subunit